MERMAKFAENQDSAKSEDVERDSKNKAPSPNHSCTRTPTQGTIIVDSLLKEDTLLGATFALLRVRFCVDNWFACWITS